MNREAMGLVRRIQLALLTRQIVGLGTERAVLMRSKNVPQRLDRAHDLLSQQRELELVRDRMLRSEVAS